MADASLAITQEYVKCFLALMGKGVFWPEDVRLSLPNQGLDQLDVMYVMSHGEVIEAEKETADGTIYIMIGNTCDDVPIRTEFWADLNQLSLRILSVERI